MKTNLMGNSNGYFYGSKIDDSCDDVQTDAWKTRKYVYGYTTTEKRTQYFRHIILYPGVLSDKCEILDYVPKWFK